MQTDVDGLVEEVSIFSTVSPASLAAVGHTRHLPFAAADLHPGGLHSVTSQMRLHSFDMCKACLEKHTAVVV